MRVRKAQFALLLLCIGCAGLTVRSDPQLDTPALEIENDGGVLPYFLRGQPEDEQALNYSPSAFSVPHTASGEGLHEAAVGVPTSFTIQLVGKDGKNLHSGGVVRDDRNKLIRFIYVWISSEDQIVIAEVKDSGRFDGALTATFTCDFPGEYLVYVEEVEPKREGHPIKGSPFSLTVTGPGPTLDVDSLPVCGSEGDARDDRRTEESFWRPGTWLSSRVASATRGVTRDGWVFQPRTCAFETFSHEDIMLLAGMKAEEPTWLLVLGGPVQRGVFLSLVDMALAQGQKDEIGASAVRDCSGYADVRIGNLRVTYQDMQLYRLKRAEDSVICSGDKLITGSTRAFVRSSEEFLRSTVFQDGTPWPSVILAPSNLVDRPTAPNLAINVLVDALPPTWKGELLFADHMAGFGHHWSQENPTMTELRQVGISQHGKLPSEDSGLGMMGTYESRDPRISFMSVFPMYQAKLFENQNTKGGIRKYGSSEVYHYVSSEPSSREAYDGAKMVHSSITEMLANIMIGKAVGTKAAFYDKVAKARQDADNQWCTDVGQTIEVCHDCPSGGLDPFHVKPVPEPDCATGESLPGDAIMREAWDGELCPSWCMKQKPVAQAPSEPGPVDVRECRLDSAARDSGAGGNRGL